MIQYLEAITKEKPIYSKILFLAGGISNCPDWQREVIDNIKDMNITVYNPRRKTFDIETSEQIIWEFEALRKSTHISFWFPKETVCPITLFEYGAALERDTKLIVGCDRSYSRLFDIIVQTELKRPEMPIHLELSRLISKIKEIENEN